MKAILPSLTVIAQIFLINPSSAQEDWPAQPPLPAWSEWTALSSPHGRAGEPMKPLFGKALFFTKREALDRYRSHPENVDRMLRHHDCHLLLKADSFTPLETFVTWNGRARDERYGEGYVVQLYFTRGPFPVNIAPDWPPLPKD